MVLYNSKFSVKLTLYNSRRCLSANACDILQYLWAQFIHLTSFYSVFHQFRQTKFAYGGLIFSSSQFLLLPQLPQKMELASKVVKVDSK